MGMTLDQATELADYLTDDLGIEARVMEDYSGRGMYGKCVPAIVLDDADIVAVGYAAGQIGLDFDAIPRRTDSMGLGVVVY